MTYPRSGIIIYIITLIYSACQAALPAGLRSQLPIQVNAIEGINFSCDVNNFNITLTMRQPFKGLLFAKDFAQECRMLGTSSPTVSVILPTSGCGVSLTSSPPDRNNGGAQMSYKVHLVVQQDRHLRQITDLEREVECQLPEEAFLVKSTPLAGVLREELKGGKIKHRVGRMKDAGWSKELEGKQLEEELEEALAAARAWMEIAPAHTEGKGSDVLLVGETASLIVKATLPAGVGWSVTDCVAYDGLGDCSQRLIDQVGCPIDPLLVPALRYAAPRPIALMRHQEASTIFPAFKFPDRDRVHLKCSLRLCRGPCPKVDCDNEDSSENRTGKFLLEAIEAEVIDRLEVFNSMEVISPEIDDLRDNERYRSENSGILLPGDRTVCVSADKMALAFCALGVVFLVAVAIAAVGLLRSRRHCTGPATPYYTRSLFSSSSGSGSAFGSKLLLREASSSSEHLAGASSSRLQYGRIM